MTDVNTRTAKTTPAATIRETSTRDLPRNSGARRYPFNRLSEFPIGHRNRQTLAARVDVFDHQPVADTHAGGPLPRDEVGGELDQAAVAYDRDNAAPVTERRHCLGLFEH